MQLDRTRIAIRQRSIWEILDLSLRVTRIYARPLFLLTMITALPFALLNLYALNWIVADEYSTSTIGRYLWLMALLVFVESPIATIPATQMLGRAMFMQEIHARSVWQEVSRVSGRLIWTQGFWRAGILCVILTLSLAPSLTTSQPETLLLLLAMYSFGLRATRPFINEVVLLERAQLGRSKQDATRVSLNRRMAALHGPRTGDLVLRWLIVCVATGVLTANLVLSCWFVSSMLTGSWNWGPVFVKLICPTCMWIAAAFATVVKFLNYMDLRIRGEGWEVELLVKAAANELRGATS